MTAARGVGAFFDIDGTLLPAPSLEWRFVSWLASRELIGGRRISGWARATVRATLCGQTTALRTNKTYLAGLPESLIEGWATSLGAGGIIICSQGTERIAWHLDRGHHVFLVSGTLLPLAKVLARWLRGSVEVRATALRLVDGLWSGSLEGNHMSGREKALAIGKIANRRGLSLADSFAYGNHLDDLSMLESVGKPVVVNPGLRLKRIAGRRGWPIVEWESLREARAATVGSFPASEEAR
jgi:HAD superfamily hydrolase (TIGR01490 family)